MAKRETREEKQARQQAEARATKANEMKKKVAHARGLRIYTERVAWEAMAHGGDGTDNKVLGTLWEMVRRYESASDDLRQRMNRLRDELGTALLRLDDGRHDAFSFSNPVATTGSNIEEAHTTRKVLGDSIAQLARATGWWVPQVHDTRAKLRHRQLATMEVVARAHSMFHIVVDGKPLTGVDMGLQPKDAAEPLVSEYESEESAWLAADAWMGSY